jgi:hypothetical protein
MILVHHDGDLRLGFGGREQEMALAGRDPTPSSAVASKELLEEARRRLSEEERHLVELRGQGLSREEVAESLGGSRPCSAAGRPPAARRSCRSSSGATSC